MDQLEKQYRISNIEASVLITCAIFCDVVSLIPGLNFVSVIFGAGGLGIYFKLKGVDLVSTKKIATWGLNGVAELIPGVSTVWVGFTIGVILMLAIIRTEDRTGLRVPTPKPGGRVKVHGGRQWHEKAGKRLAQTEDYRARRQERFARIQKLRSRQNASGSRSSSDNTGPSKNLDGISPGFSNT